MTSLRFGLLLALVVLALLSLRCASAPDPARAFAPPPTRTVDQVDEYHGVRIPDPYRWLEDIDGEETSAWIDAQNAASETFLAALPERESFRRRLTELWNYPRRGAPAVAGGSWAWFANDGMQNQSVLYVGDDPEGPGRVLLDPNALSADGTTALAASEFSRDGARLAYAVQHRGSDWMEWRVMDVTSGSDLADRLQWSKFSAAAWTPDGRGFFYQRYPEPAAGEALEAVNLAPELCYHALGTPQADDRVVYARPDEPTWGFRPTVTEDGRYLVITMWVGTDRRNRVAFVDLSDEAWPVQQLLMDFDAGYAFVGNDGDTLYFHTDHDAPRGRLIAVDIAAPGADRWRQLVAEGDDTLEGVTMVGDQFVLTYMRDACHVARACALDGSELARLQLPPTCSIGAIEGRRDRDHAFFTVSSFTEPTSVWRYDGGDHAVRPTWRAETRIDPAAIEAHQVSLQSADGTRVPMFLVHRRGLVLDGSNATYLYGYGGFNVSLTPTYSPAIMAWIDSGGVYAQPTLRGGGEYGEHWHQAGMRAHKQNVFADFLAAAEYLLRNRYTGREHLAIGGGSNGGLLVGAAMTQRPGLFAAAVPQVGVLDMLRYHRFTIGWAWAPEYGTAEEADMFPVLRAYSPLHNLRPGTAYPATLILTGDHDDRVLPAHSYKFAAALQACQGGDAPVVLRVDRKTGHGAGKPVSKQIEAAADLWAFVAWATRG